MSASGVPMTLTMYFSQSSRPLPKKPQLPMSSYLVGARVRLGGWGRGQGWGWGRGLRVRVGVRIRATASGPPAHLVGDATDSQWRAAGDESTRGGEVAMEA